MTKYYVPDELIVRISLFGDKEVGKTTLAKNINPEFFKNESTIDVEGLLYTIGVAFVNKNTKVFGKWLRLSISLISDEKRFQNLWIYYVSRSWFFILMYDITNPNSMNYLSEVLQILKNVREKFVEEHSRNILILLVGNKLDLEELREISKEQIEQFKEEYDISDSMEISLKTGENIEHMFVQLNKMIIRELKKTGTIEEIMDRE